MASAITSPRTNLPVGFNFSGRGRTAPPRIGYQSGKTKSQVQFLPKMQTPIGNGGNNSNNGLNEAGYDIMWGEPSETNWYPSARPLKQHRYRGSSNAVGTYVSTDDIPNLSSQKLDGKTSCKLCPRSAFNIGRPFKMIGKDNDGINKELKSPATANYDSNNCLVCDPTRGPVLNQITVGPTHGKGSVISFSGAAKLKSGVTLLSKNYYPSHISYMKARGKNYDSNAIVHKISGIEYNKATPGGSEIVWPEKPQKVGLAESPFLGQTLDSSFYRGNSCVPTVDYEGNDYNKLHASENCSLSIYKPNNSQFAVQGAVDSSSRITRLKYNTITKNNASFFNNGDTTQWGLSMRSNIVPNLMYQSNPVFFIKNKASNARAFHHNGNRTVCGGYDYSPCNGPSKMAFTLPLSIGGR
jgi:hypothetical protein